MQHRASDSRREQRDSADRQHPSEGLEVTRNRSRQSPKSAAELMADLEKDPKYMAQVRDREQRQRANIENYSRSAEPILKKLEGIGFLLGTIGELRHEKSEYRPAVPILLRWLPRVANPQVKEDIVRTLSVPWAKPDAAPVLIEEFRKAESDSLQWAIANSLAVTADDAVLDEIVRIVQDAHYGKAREMLVLALGNMKSPRAVIALMGLLDDEQLVGHAVVSLGKLKAVAAHLHLKDLTSHPTSWVRNEAKKALAIVEATLH
jgi:HEAT repeats